ncbi:uncharacterized protein LOC114880886 isoform X1 [Osmia bicornis bicornis]|uniref:uncharacterized protein LOC114880886 isoform X1 n=1 Tax=Osmia bicornis bicornis TaxID=1437191 RepID=UPI001EAF8C1C|nr:uncharacterized protein LOC114880886 isoform X1 [Osmia bicornis bicornis]
MGSSGQLYSLSWGEFSSSLASAVQLLRGHGDLVDVTLAAGGRSFPAHKIVLCAASPFLLDLLKSTPCQHPVVMLAGIAADDLESLLEFVYRGEVSVEPSQLPSLLQAAHCLCIHGLTPPTILTENGEEVPISAIPTANEALSKETVSPYFPLKRKRKRRKSSSSSGKWPRTSNTTDNENRSVDGTDNRSAGYDQKDEDNTEHGDDTGDGLSKSRSMSDQPASCPLCGAILRQSRNLRRHLELLHFGLGSNNKSTVDTGYRRTNKNNDLVRSTFASICQPHVTRTDRSKPAESADISTLTSSFIASSNASNVSLTGNLMGPGSSILGTGDQIPNSALVAATSCTASMASVTNGVYSSDDQISDVCKKNFMRDLYRKIDGAVLISQHEKDLDCTITFQTHSILQRFMLRFDQLQLDCNDHLYIYDGAHAVSSYKEFPSLFFGVSRRFSGLQYDRKYKRHETRSCLYSRLKMMARNCDSCSFVLRCVFLTCLVILHAAKGESCDKTKCPGPLRYYKELGCTPVYKNPGDCCAEEYDCSHLKSLSKDKCYANGHEYSIGDKLRDEDRNPCDIECSCRSYLDQAARFVCAALDCPMMVTPGCYYKNSIDQCCPGPLVCPEKGEERATCEVDGKTYMDGEFFKPESSDPDLSCYCQPGYKGENVEPFCKMPNRSYCSPLFRNAPDIHQNCAPVFYDNQNPQQDCSYASRCQNANDTVIHNHESGKSLSDEDNKTCQFGDMKMHIGDELNQGTNYDSTCVKCVCEVPPIPTCQRLPDNECDVTDHGPFISL